MCGLVGAAGDIGHKEKVALKQLLWVDTLRGAHSTGVAGIKKFIPKDEDEVTILKTIGNTNVWLHQSELKEVDNPLDSQLKVAIGHNRFATTGEINKANAHPFYMNDIVGAHNGTLTKFYLDNLPDHKEFDVDSMALFNAISTLGVEETYKLLHGAWALAWYDLKKKKLKFVRNEKRPLYYCITTNGKTMFWASERWMLEGILPRNRISIGDVEDFDEDVVYRVDMDINTNIDKLEISKSKVLESHTPAYSSNSYYFGDDYYRNLYGGSSHNVSTLFKDPTVRDIDKYWTGEEIPFYYVGEDVDKNNSKFYQCNSLGTEPFDDIRCYLFDKDKIKLLKESTQLIFGRVKHVKYDIRTFKPYVVIDVKSLTEEFQFEEWYSSDECLEYDKFVATFNNRFSNLRKDESKELTILPPVKEVEDVTSKTMYVVGSNSKTMSQEEYVAKTEDGCGNCSEVIGWRDRLNLYWFNDVPYCSKCVGDTTVKEYLNIN